MDKQKENATLNRQNNVQIELLLVKHLSVVATDRRRLDLRNVPSVLVDVFVSAGNTCAGKSYARFHDPDKHIMHNIT
jgi:hypothetical protein